MAEGDNIPSPVRDEASCWSDLPRVLQHYLNLSDKEGNGLGRLFGYASLVKDHKNEKPPASADLPNEDAALPGMEVAMNVLAVGREFRGASGTYTDARGKRQYFANTGLYAGLEPALTPDGCAYGKNITSLPADRVESLTHYIKRELGMPPKGLPVEYLFDATAASKFGALKGTDQDEFGMYKFQIVNTVKTEKGENRQVPSITVSTNGNSRFSALGLTPIQAAERILDGQGYCPKEGESTKGGAALDYFNNDVLGTARSLDLYQPRLEAIHQAVQKLTNIWGLAGDIESLPLQPEQKKGLVRRIHG